MPIRYDIKITSDDISFANGDLETAASDMQHIEDTINAFAGWWKEFPLDGVGVLGYMKGAASEQEIGRKIKIELSSDGYSCNAPIVTLDSDGKLLIDPNIKDL